VIIEAVGSQVAMALWPSLHALLDDAPATQERVASVIGTRVSPVVRPSDFVARSDEIRRFVIADPERSTQYAALIGPDADFNGMRPGTDRDTLQLVALRNADLSPDRGGAAQ
jgi:hypothetical protein